MMKKRILCAWLVLCLLSTLAVGALAGSSVGSSPSSVTPSATKVYICLTKAVAFFTGEVYGSGNMVIANTGEVYQLVSDDFYVPSDGLAYYGVYYQNTRMNVLRSDVYSDIMTAAALESYISKNIWSATSFTTLKESLGLVGDVRVHALQLALQKLGYYTGTPDGNYGTATTAAVKAFQKSYGLTADGSAGVLTQPVIYAAVTGNSSSTSQTTETTTETTTDTTSQLGTLVTTVSVNMRKAAQKSSALLTVIPAATTLSYTAQTQVSDVTWYKVSYNNLTGWIMGTYTSLNGSGSSSTSTSGQLTTTSSVNLRQSATTSSQRISIVPSGATLPYSSTQVNNGITWYYVTYGTMKGWIMGTYAKVSGSSSSTITAIGQVKITKSNTRIRKTANGAKTGYVLALGTVVDMIGSPTSAGGYTWYYIRTSSGLCGYVRGDCAEVVNGTSSETVVADGSVKFAKLTEICYAYTTETKPASGYVTIAAGTVVKLYSQQTYTVNNVQYIKIYYNNKAYNTLYSNVSSCILSDTELTSYVNTLYSSTLTSPLKASLNLTGDVRVYALQLALKELGYFTATATGDFTGETTTAVKNFQRSQSLTVDGSCGNNTWKALAKALNGSGSSSGSSSQTVTDFGTFTKVVKASWNYNDNGATIFPKGTYATVMDIETGKVFKVYRWSGGSHADCVPATESDTKTMCDIVGFTYNSNHPTSAQLAKIKADGDKSTITYTWPDFKAAFGGTATNIGSKWDRRAALLNVDGTVYCVSIYGFPHGFNGTDSFSKSKFPDGTLFYAKNNYYGMMCIHFVGSKTHTGTSPDTQHQANIDKAYNYAKSLWPSLCQ